MSQQFCLTVNYAANSMPIAMGARNNNRQVIIPLFFFFFSLFPFCQHQSTCQSSFNLLQTCLILEKSFTRRRRRLTLKDDLRPRVLRLIKNFISNFFFTKRRKQPTSVALQKRDNDDATWALGFGLQLSSIPSFNLQLANCQLQQSLGASRDNKYEIAARQRVGVPF